MTHLLMHYVLSAAAVSFSRILATVFSICHLISSDL
jgi:hypothetical protein